MENKFDVVMISAFGRGHWLAQELARSGLKVALVDTSLEMGAWEPEDWEGPFGVFRHGSMTETQVGRLEADAKLEIAPRGFTVWTQQGPLELHSRLTPYLLEQHQLDSETRSYLEHASRFEVSSEKGPLKRKLLNAHFEQTWLSHLAHQFAANHFASNAESMSYGSPLALFSDWMIRRVSSRGFEDHLKTLQGSGIEVFSQCRLLDVGLSGGQVDAIEIKSQTAGLIRGRYFVWALSSEDALRFSAPVHSKFFPNGVLDSEWAWVRYQMKLGQVEQMHPLPSKFVLLENVHLPWTHSNLAVFTQCDHTPELWDTWVRIPTQSRFQRGYLEKIADELILQLRRRVPGLAASTARMPADYVHNLNEIGAPRFPVFNRHRLQAFKPSAYRNFYFSGPEVWQNLDWSAQFAHQGAVLKSLHELWLKEQEKEKRRLKS